MVVVGGGVVKTALQDQHEVDGHLVCSVENPHMADTTQSLGARHQSGRPGQRQPEQRPGGPQTKPRRLDQTNHPVCGKVSLNRGGGGDWLCAPLFIAVLV